MDYQEEKEQRIQILHAERKELENLISTKDEEINQLYKEIISEQYIGKWFEDKHNFFRPENGLCMDNVQGTYISKTHFDISYGNRHIPTLIGLPEVDEEKVKETLQRLYEDAIKKVFKGGEENG